MSKFFCFHKYEVFRLELRAAETLIYKKCLKCSKLKTTCKRGSWSIGDFDKQNSGTCNIYSEDYLDQKRKAKALDMACCLFDIQNNLWRKFKHTDYDYQPFMDAINECIDDHNIIIDDLIE